MKKRWFNNKEKKNYPDLFFCSVEADSIIKVIRLLCMSIGIDLDI